MFPGPASQRANTQVARSPHGCVNLRDRIKAFSVVKHDENQQAPEETVYQSPSDAFFGWPNNATSLINTQQEPAARHQKQSHHVRHDCEKPGSPQVLQQHRPTLSELQATESPMARTLIDYVTANRDALYNGAIEKLVTAKRDLEQTFADATAEDDLLFNHLEISHKKTAKPLSETRIHDHRVGAQIHIGERIISFKELIDTLETEIASLWDQWEAAQKEVNHILAELASEQRGTERDQPASMMAIKESLAREMSNYEEELGGILKEAHEEVRVSEKDFSRKMRGVVSALVQQYFLE